MTNELLFDLRLKSHPYPQDPKIAIEAWGVVSIYLLNNGNNKLLLFEKEWNISDLIEWYVDNCLLLCEEEFSIQGKISLPQENIYQAINRIRMMETDEEEGFQRDEAIYSYLRRHSVDSAFIGLFPSESVIIGRNHGKGEISISVDTDTRSYEFDIDSFCKSMPEILRNFMFTWVINAKNENTKKYAYDLLKALEQKNR